MRLRVRNFVSAVSILAAIYLVLFFRFAEVDGVSMEPTYDNADFLVLYRTTDVERGDIIAVRSEDLNKVLCKRVIGVSGDHVVINKTGLFLNDVQIDESYVASPSWAHSSKYVDLVVGSNEVFVMGDNRIVSNDSRSLGCFQTTGIVGKVALNATKAIGVRKSTLIILTAVLAVLSVISELCGNRINKWSFGRSKGNEGSV